ncbi:hypothetical protein QTP86_030316 [Hemibagrus guttatus]|nr:hypothetical protein QTP86_030316 [Hemibagrus guttatus]
MNTVVSGVHMPWFVWEKDGQVINPKSSPRLRLDINGTLHISQTWSGDIGSYTCRVTSQGGNDSHTAHLKVRQLPHAPENPSAILSSVEKRAINLTWAKPFDGNSPLIRYILEVSENNAPWTVLMADVDPSSTALTVSELTPARSYQFRLCAENNVGRGAFSPETRRVSLPEEPPSAPPQNVIASGRTNSSIMIQWQPPPENQQNGALRGYIIRYRLTGLPVDIQYKNSSNPEVTNLLLEDLIIWTNYEIEVAAYNGAGLGVYSHKVTEWTLRGAFSMAGGAGGGAYSCYGSAEFPGWYPCWLHQWPKEIYRVFHISFVFSPPPGDGPRTPAQRIRTHEDTPGAVGHLSFTEILDTSLKVSWREPHEKNGILTGYRISWEEFNRTNTRVTHYLPNVTLEYRVTGLTAFKPPTPSSVTTTNIKGQSYRHYNFCSYLPKNKEIYYPPCACDCTRFLLFHRRGVQSREKKNPKLPGPPTNLAISNIGPRSVTLQFKPGYDGKTSISRWQVEAQISVIGENEDWVMVHQLINEPHARSMEIPALNPYTFYRFRMRQVNIVGTSPPSQPSRKIQTLQAPPDMAPLNITLRTASETSLWLRWVPLPEWEFNGNPESVGYKVQYSRIGPDAEVLTHIIPDRLEREFTIEDLEEWTEYEVKVRAINGIGAGPWSQPVRGRTRESDKLRVTVSPFIITLLLSDRSLWLYVLESGVSVDTAALCVPSSGPSNISAFSTSSSSILVRWFEVPEPDRNGLILGYKVVYKEKDSDSPLQLWTVEGNTTHSAELTNLGKYVLYEIQVLAFTRIGDGLPSSPSILERTLDDVPGPPVGILFPEVRTTSVRLIWQSPAQPNGIILAYQITYRLNSSNSNSATVDVLNPSARQYTVNSLKPESVYIFSITAQTRKGWGDAAEALVVTTEKRARPQPPRHLMVPQESVRARSVLMSWEPGSDGLSPVRYYTVQIRELPDQNWTVQSASVNHEVVPYTVDRLKPFTSYQFRVKATNDIGDSDYSQESDAITTLQDVPDEAPIILSVTPHTTTSVLIRWLSPSEEKINGILLGFYVRYRELVYERLRNFNIQKLSSWTELTYPYSMRNLSDPSLSQYELDTLSKHKRYEVRMSVFNAVGEGPISSPQEVFVGEAVNLKESIQSSPVSKGCEAGVMRLARCRFLSPDQWFFTVPTAPPQNVAIQSATATQLDVTWDPPPLDRQNGDIQGYKVYFWEYERKNETEKLKTLFLPDGGVKLKNLTGFTTYMISVAPFNAAGDGPRSPAIRGRTQQAGVSKIVTVDVKGNAPLWLKIKDLVDGVTYNFRIRAKTFTYGPEVEANITTGPGEVGNVVGHENIVSASRMNSAIVVFLNDVEKVRKLTQNGIVGNNETILVSPLSSPDKKVMLSNVPPFISDEAPPLRKSPVAACPERQSDPGVSERPGRDAAEPAGVVPPAAKGPGAAAAPYLTESEPQAQPAAQKPTGAMPAPEKPRTAEPATAEPRSAQPDWKKPWSTEKNSVGSGAVLEPPALTEAGTEVQGNCMETPDTTPVQGDGGDVDLVDEPVFKETHSDISNAADWVKEWDG